MPQGRVARLDNSLQLTQISGEPDVKYAGTRNGGKALLHVRGKDALFTPPGKTEMTCRFEETG